MPNIETSTELADAIADMVGVYGSYYTNCQEKDQETYGCNCDHEDDCKCRSCFVISMASRIRTSVSNDEKMRKLNDGTRF